MGDAGTILTSVCLGIALAAATGMRIFLPLLISGIAIRFGLFGVSPMTIEGQAWLGSNTALICFSVATVTEALAYKIPMLDHLLDVIGAPAALLAGSVLATTFLIGIDDPVLRYGLGIVAGAGSAGIVHSTTALARVASTKTTGGLGNPVLAMGELAGATITSILAFLMPVLIAMIFVFATIILLHFVKKRLLKAQS